jgi:hypothetical protein
MGTLSSTTNAGCCKHPRRCDNLDEQKFGFLHLFLAAQRGECYRHREPWAQELPQRHHDGRQRTRT